MKSWVYVFSQFTPEALLFEALCIFTLCAGYTGFWILRKRRLGVMGEAVPAGVVKIYMAQLIADAEEMRTQLFGLLRTAGAPMPRQVMVPQMAAGPTTTIESNDPALLEKVAKLESKMNEQDSAMARLLREKEKIEKDLMVARSATGSAAGAGDAAALKELQAKIATLEGKLAEYSVIEDDLANLKRLQQENAQLRAQLAGQGGTVAAPAKAAAPAPTPEPLAAAPEPEPLIEDAAPAEAPMAAAEVAPEEAFEGLVDQVEESLAPAVAEAAPAPAPVAAAPAPAAPAPAGAGNDADLVAEFEKMLKT